MLVYFLFNLLLFSPTICTKNTTQKKSILKKTHYDFVCKKKRMILNAYLLYALYDFAICNYMKAFKVEGPKDSNYNNDLEIILQENYRIIKKHSSLNWKTTKILLEVEMSGMLQKDISRLINEISLHRVNNQSFLEKNFSNNINSIISIFMDENEEIISEIYNMWSKTNSGSKESMIIEISRLFFDYKFKLISNKLFASIVQKFNSTKKLISLATITIKDEKDRNFFKVITNSARKIILYLCKIIIRVILIFANSS